jgi:hypothetical protein
VRIVGENFSACLRTKDGVITQADRSIRWAVGKPVARMLALAERWHWEVQFSDAERMRGEDQCDRAL